MAVEPSTRPDAHTVSAETEMLVPAMFQNLIGYHLRVAQETSFQAFARAAGKADLKPGWYALLTVLAERESMTPSEPQPHLRSRPLDAHLQPQGIVPSRTDRTAAEPRRPAQL
ncbi:hypothetical protein LZK73_25525 (plasmid) [Neorhizobium galegae]|nr:hypothetical protein LZK73_25525 [Neorhizobium galegae]